MRARVQICAKDKDEKIQLLYKHLNMLGAIHSLKPTVLTPENKGVSEWCSDFYECQTNFPEDEILELLGKDLLASLKAIRGTIDTLMVVLVCAHDPEPNDRPRGYSISLDLVKTLAELGASLEIDITNNLNAFSALTK
ncbi:MAG: hypothetical protein V9G29_03515 [Burkholderiaceae bacterium]